MVKNRMKKQVSFKGVSEIGNEKSLVFVYGSLKRGGERNGYLTAYKSNFVKEDSINDFVMFNFMNQYPYIYEGNGLVFGEVWEIEDKYLSSLDYIEGVGMGLFKRQLVRTLSGLDCWVYVSGDTLILNGKQIPSGVWE